jgi:hypothetical protein
MQPHEAYTAADMPARKLEAFVKQSVKAGGGIELFAEVACLVDSSRKCTDAKGKIITACTKYHAIQTNTNQHQPTPTNSTPLPPPYLTPASLA